MESFCSAGRRESSTWAVLIQAPEFKHAPWVKNVPKIPPASSPAAMRIDGSFADWSFVADNFSAGNLGVRQPQRH